MPDNNKWYFLGTVTATKFVDKEYPCFAIDVTGIEKGEPETDGSEQEATARCRRFANQLAGRFKLPVELVDERGSSMEAQKITRNAPDDAVAAAIILQRYFDALT